jgi:hypothetical protein
VVERYLFLYSLGQHIPRKAAEGEAYRESLQHVRSRVEDNILFKDQLGSKDLGSYQCSRYHITPYLDPEQISGRWLTQSAPGNVIAYLSAMQRTW